jgi:lysophospholipase L1-like esterase
MRTAWLKIIIAFIGFGVAIGLATLVLIDDRGPTVTAADRIRAATTVPEPPMALFIGDSYIGGTGAERGDGGFAWTVASKMGWKPVIDGQGGTGYVSRGPQTHNERQPVRERIVDDTEQFDFDYVIIAAGLNDSSRGYSAEKIEAEAAAAFRGVHEAEPQARLIVIGPFWPGDGWVLESAQQVSASVKKAALADGALYLDPFGEKWLTGRKGDNNGNAERYISSDGTQPNQKGHDYLAGRIVRDLAEAGIVPEPAP